MKFAEFCAYQYVLKSYSRKYSEEEVTKGLENVLGLIRSNPQITYAQLMESLNIKETAIYERIKKLKDRGLLKREGGRSSGFWIVIK